MEELPRVSVVVLTYNSSRTLVETLDSIASQTYKDIELIISDDCSKDDTIEIAKEWINKHKERFVQTKILNVEKNTGVSANWNRGVAACESDYWKGIAGDDLLEPNCLQEYVDYIINNPDALVVFSRVNIFGRAKVIKKFENPFVYNFFSLSIKEQLDYLINKSNCIPAPSVFLNIKRLKENGILADERIPMLEDYPMWINMLSAGIRFHFIDKPLVRYRIGGASLSTGVNKKLMVDSERLFELLYIIPRRYSDDWSQAMMYIYESEKKMISKILRTHEYKLGVFLLKLPRKFRSFLRKLDVN